MKKKNGKVKTCLIIVLLIFIINIFIGIDKENGQFMNKLSYNIKINEDGSMNVIETWDIYVKNTNTLFRNFGRSSDKYNISNVKVRDLTKGIDLNEIYEEQYHVDTDCYYALNVQSTQFEIAWGTGLEEKTKNKIYEISYTVDNVINDYKDCQEFYWKLLDKSNGIPCKKIIGTVSLPKDVRDIDNLKVWGHGKINGEIKRESKDKIKFDIKGLPTKSMLELRVVNLDKIYNINNENNIKNYNNLNNILREEEKWANDTNSEIKENRIISRIFAGIYLVFIILGIIKIIKYYKISRKDGTGIKAKNLEYFREIPREGQSTPGEAAILYFFKENYELKSGVQSDVIAATILDLCLKKCITLRVDDKSVYVKIINENIKMKKDEEVVFKLLKDVANKREEFEIEELKIYAKNKYSSFSNNVQNLVVNSKKNLYKEGLIDRKKEKDYKFATRTSGICVVFILIIYCVMVYLLMCNIPIFRLQYTSIHGIGIFQRWIYDILMLIPAFIELYLLYKYSDKSISKMTTLTQKGKDEEIEWKALAKFMKNYSMLDEKKVPDLVLWEKYLVFATAFGISEKVIEQLKARYPYVFTDDYWIENENNSATVLNVLLAQNNSSFNYTISHISDAVESANRISAAEMASHYSSSGSGGGGGFSSGGGGRRRRWPEWVEDKRRFL